MSTSRKSLHDRPDEFVDGIEPSGDTTVVKSDAPRFVMQKQAAGRPPLICGYHPTRNRDCIKPRFSAVWIGKASP